LNVVERMTPFGTRAWTVTTVFVVTALVVTVKPTLVEPAGTTTETGTARP
jgi:hypothetical protein